MDSPCKLFHKHLHFFHSSPLTLTPSVDFYFSGRKGNKIFEQLCKCTLRQCTIQYGNGSEKKMDSLRTDGMSAESHLLWLLEDISDNVKT